METAPIPSDQKKKALRYAELQLKKTKQELTAEEAAEMERIPVETGRTHTALIQIATNDIVAS
jgi:hypothetical protein